MSLSIGIIELSSITAGFVVQDAMLKAAEVNLLVARTVCPGKYLVVIGGKVTNVKTSIKSGLIAASGFLVDNRVIHNVDERVFPALSGAVEIPKRFSKAVGVIETFSAASAIQAADAAVKAANVVLFRVHLAMAIGGKAFLLVCGDVTAAKAAIDAGINAIKADGMLVNKAVISGASRELFREFI